MRALDGRVEFQFTLRYVARGALVVVDLRATGMVHSAREVDVIVTCPAGFCRGLCQVRGCLRGAALRVMAGLPARRGSPEHGGGPCAPTQPTPPFGGHA